MGNQVGVVMERFLLRLLHPYQYGFRVVGQFNHPLPDQRIDTFGPKPG